MLANPARTRLQEHGAQLLASTSHALDGEELKPLCDGGAAEALVHALTACHKLTVQQYGCQALANLAHGESVAEQALIDAQAAPALTAAIEAHLSLTLP